MRFGDCPAEFRKIFKNLRRQTKKSVCSLRPALSSNLPSMVRLACSIVYVSVLAVCKSAAFSARSKMRNLSRKTRYARSDWPTRARPTFVWTMACTSHAGAEPSCLNYLFQPAIATPVSSRCNAADPAVHCTDALCLALCSLSLSIY